jgi:hypothetical protein
VFSCRAFKASQKIRHKDIFYWKGKGTNNPLDLSFPESLKERKIFSPKKNRVREAFSATIALQTEGCKAN